MTCTVFPFLAERPLEPALKVTNSRLTPFSFLTVVMGLPFLSATGLEDELRRSDFVMMFLYVRNGMAVAFTGRPTVTRRCVGGMHDTLTVPFLLVVVMIADSVASAHVVACLLVVEGLTHLYPLRVVMNGELRLTQLRQPPGAR